MQAPDGPKLKFTILGHAALHVETPDCSILMDPWLVGSCYWRSWWHYPPPPDHLIRTLKPDFIYITHLHWDHFHGVSLHRFDPATPILVPRAHFDRMVKDLRSLGFRNTIELTHGVPLALKGRTVVTSYQFGLALDSAIVVDTGRHTLLNANDCKLMGAPLLQVVRNHPRVDFVFRSHSSASPYPFCVSSDFPEHMNYRAKEDYAREFLAFAEAVDARYAIPFASNHCFLHQDTWRFNDTAVSPCDVKAYFDAHKRGRTECQVMLPGDSWSDDGGFAVAPQDFFTDRERHLKELQTKHAATLQECYTREGRVKPHWESFRKYFSRMLASLPPGFEIILPARILFQVGSARWLLDFRRRKVLESADSLAHDMRIDVPPAVLRDCCMKRMFSTFTAGKRVHFHLRTPRALRYYFIFTGLLDMYESEYLPIRALFRKRFLTTWLRRWREILFYFRVALSILRPGTRLRPVDYMPARHLSRE